VADARYAHCAGEIDDATAIIGNQIGTLAVRYDEPCEVGDPPRTATGVAPDGVWYGC
jgi:hypothetical protein